jgi:hypothetical protein
LATVLEQIREATSGDSVSFGEFIDALGQRAYGPMMLVPAIIAVAPTGAIPGMSVVTGTLIFLLAAQLLIGRASPWLPGSLLRFSFSRNKLVAAIERTQGFIALVDRLLSPRLTFLVGFPVNRLAALACIVLALTMFPLALLPFAVAIPGTTIAIIALGLTARDGAVVLLGLILGLGTLALTIFWGVEAGYQWLPG